MPFDDTWINEAYDNDGDRPLPSSMLEGEEDYYEEDYYEDIIFDEDFSWLDDIDEEGNELC